MDARESPNAGAAKHAQQHRLRLIVESVSRRNLRRPTLARQLAKKTVAQFPRGRLDSGRDFGNMTAVNRRDTNIQFEPMLPRQFATNRSSSSDSFPRSL